MSEMMHIRELRAETYDGVNIASVMVGKVVSNYLFYFFFQAEDGIRDYKVTGVQTCALPIWAEHTTRMRGHGRRAHDPDRAARSRSAPHARPGTGDVDPQSRPCRGCRHHRHLWRPGPLHLVPGQVRGRGRAPADDHGRGPARPGPRARG